MQGCAHLTREKRYHIEVMRRADASIRRIAAGMKRLNAKPKCVRILPELVAFERGFTV